MKMTDEFAGFLKAIFPSIPVVIAQAFKTYKWNMSVVEEVIADYAKDLGNLSPARSFEDILSFLSRGVPCHSLLSS